MPGIVLGEKMDSTQIMSTKSYESNSKTSTKTYTL